MTTQPTQTQAQPKPIDGYIYFCVIAGIWTSFFSKKISIAERDRALGRYRRQLSASDGFFTTLDDLL